VLGEPARLLLGAQRLELDTAATAVVRGRRGCRPLALGPCTFDGRPLRSTADGGGTGSSARLT
jgi:hypothetical protein